MDDRRDGQASGRAAKASGRAVKASGRAANSSDRTGKASGRAHDGTNKKVGSPWQTADSIFFEKCNILLIF